MYHSVTFKDLENLGIHTKPQKLFSQSYDDAPTMSGKLGGVQLKIREKCLAATRIS